MCPCVGCHVCFGVPHGVRVLCHVLDLLMVMNFAFIEGKYNGSTLTILGRNAVFHKVREMPIIGGSGLFIFAREYAQASTHWIDVKSGDAIVECNVYVFYY